MNVDKKEKFWGVMRIVMALIMLWAFFDKLFGLGFATTSEKAWINGASPTMGFLKFGTEGSWFASIFQGMAGSAVVDWLFMLGLLLIGLALLFGIGMKIAGKAGALMMLLMWLAIIPPENNPILDDHVVYFLIFLGLAHSTAAGKWSLQCWWKNTELVKKHPIL